MKITLDDICEMVQITSIGVAMLIALGYATYTVISMCLS